MNTARVNGVFCLLMMSVTSVQAGFGDFLKGLNPATAKYETFEGRYLDKVIAETSTVASADDVNRVLEESPTAAGGPAVSGSEIVRFHADSLLGNARLNAYLEGIIERLLSDTPWQSRKWSVFVAVNRTHNAQTYPDGTVVLTLPLLLDIESEDELAMVLAHEVSHVILAHHGTDWFVDSQKRLVAGSETSLLMVEQLAQQLPQTNVNLGDAKQKLRTLALVRDISSDLLYPEWQRGQEEEADLLGMDLMIRNGYSPDEVFTLFEKQQQAAEAAAAEDKSKEELESALNEQVQQSLANSNGNMSGLFQGLGDVLLTGLEGLRKKLKRTHPEYDKRLTFLANYREREYAGLEPGEPRTKPWQSLRRRPPLKTLFTQHARAFEASHLADTGDVVGAAALVYKLQKGPHRREPYIEQVSSQVRSAQGQTREATQYLLQAVQDRRAGYPVYEDLANLLGNAGHPQQAVRVLQQAASQFTNLPHLRMSQIYWTNQAGDTSTAQRLALACRVAYPDYDQTCAEKLKAPVLRRTVVDLGPTMPMRQLSRSEVQKLQGILNRLGYAVGRPDGLPGKKTRNAVSRFQRDVKLTVSGHLDEATAAKLYTLDPGI